MCTYYIYIYALKFIIKYLAVGWFCHFYNTEILSIISSERIYSSLKMLSS